MDELRAPRLATGRLVLDPLRVADAEAMTDVLADPALYRHTGGTPPTTAALREQYRRQAAGPGRPGESWLTWVVRVDGEPLGYVQATVVRGSADLAWVVGTAHQGRGVAREAAGAVAAWAGAAGLDRLTAHIAPGHTASEAVAAAVGLAPTGEHDEDGEQVWAGQVPQKVR